MKTILTSVTRSKLFLFFILVVLKSGSATAFQVEDSQNYVELKGKIVSQLDGEPIYPAHISLLGTNISTTTNSEGVFSLKVQQDNADNAVLISSIGFEKQQLPADYFRGDNAVVELVEVAHELAEVAVYAATEPLKLVENMLKKRGENSINGTMTAFYRESVKRRSRNVSLSEAVIRVHKGSKSTNSKDKIEILKARKSTDYERLDTLALKLLGGPFNTLYLDLVKYPEFLFYTDDLDSFEFKLGKPDNLDGRHLIVVDFVEKDKTSSWYQGKLYIDADSNNLVRASYQLNVDKNDQALTDLFVKSKPGGTKVYPTEVHYHIEYRNAEGKWYYGYGRAELEFLVNWKRKLFNTRYTVNSEMAVTDWQLNPGLVDNDSFFIDKNVVMVDDVSGFVDNHFWGANNIIEPDQSIQNAIEKIQKQIRKQ